MAGLWITPEEMGDDGRSAFAYEACKTSSFILWALSGRRYTGITTVTETYECPCRKLTPYSHLSQYAESGLFPAGPYMIDGAIQNMVYGGSACDCGCSGVINGVHTKLRLRGRPVRSISRVVQDGKVLDPDEYQLVNRALLTGAPGACVDMCGVEVTYTYGLEPPTAGRRAARYLATELVKSYSGKECELPERVTSVSRQGVTVTVLDEQAFIDDLRTGVYAVDLFLKAVNPDNARKPARVFSPDLPKAQWVTGPHAAPAIGPLDLAIVPGEPFSWTYALDAANAELLSDGDWVPQGQISTWSGAILLDVEPDHFTTTGNQLTFQLTASETGSINIGGSGVWDLYTLNVADQATVIHVMNSNVYLVGAPAPLIG